MGRRSAGVSPYIEDVERMFLGQHEHVVDDKGRLMVPARFRELLGSNGYITLGFDQNLMVLPAEVFERLAEHARTMSLTDPNARLLKRLLFSHAERVDIDRVGRILIPQWLRKDAEISSRAIVVGMGDYFEIWSYERWEEHRQLLQDPEANAQRFTSLELSL
ncbi:MAG: division/cell wall cluster transcriptional repressor MraZ [Thermanaerothrix sp.]|uniref:division/cell wall cluster transcriptional repressor MraZ n=1 Tax=Thermanaerothrix sp. TaxID=2972675 RepID=UPI003C7CB04C